MRNCFYLLLTNFFLQYLLLIQLKEGRDKEERDKPERITLGLGTWRGNA